ncbi:MAG: DUF1122 family protein [Thermoplasmatota archaeon]
MLEDLVDDLQDGLQLKDKIIYAKKTDKGRIHNQKYMEIFCKKKTFEKLMFYLSIYQGKQPYYKPWVEIFGINDNIYFQDGVINYFDTDLEDVMLNKISENLGKGGRIFVEYSEDKETRFGLVRDYPEVVTRLGYKLYEHDFTWFKDWYYPEGFNEGGEKLQAEKPIDKKHEQNHHERIKEEINRFFQGDFEGNDNYRRAKNRAQDILANL